ncbi:hypothetical protein Aperf_G00000058183 [Anoplocephala perfoliata]
MVEVSSILPSLRAQLSSYHEVLEEEDSMKLECFGLRKHVERLKDVEYRKNAYRFRRAHASANNRVSSLDRKLEMYTSLIGQQEADLAHIVSSLSTAQANYQLVAIRKLHGCNPYVSNAASSSNETRLDLSGCLSFVDSTSSEINFRSGRLAAPALNAANMTSLVNPFKGISTQIDKAKYSKNHSSLFKLSTMKDYEKCLMELSISNAHLTTDSVVQKQIQIQLFKPVGEGLQTQKKL